MVTATSTDEFRYIISARAWFQHKRAVLRNAAIAARRAGKRADGLPDEETVVLVWRQEQGAESAA